MTTFKDLGLSEDILNALSDVGYESPSPIQEQAIPHLLQGHDVIGQAQTGTGKTAAFGLPMVQFVDPSDEDVQALVLTPTRELAIQVAEAFHAYGKHRGVTTLPVYGGQPIDRQFRAFETRTGRELWSVQLPAGGKATPMTFRTASGRQLVVISAGGDNGGAFGASDAIVAYALPEAR